MGCCQSKDAQLEEAMEATLVACRGKCASRGFPFFGLGCPMASSTVCQCYTAERIDGANAATLPRCGHG